MNVSDIAAAKRVAERFVPADCGLVEDAIRELAEGWYFVYQSDAYLKSGEASDTLIDSGGFVVERQGGRVVEFGSAFSLDENRQAYRAGLLPGPVDLELVSIHDEDAAVAGENLTRPVKPDVVRGAGPGSVRHAGRVTPLPGAPL